MFLTMVREQAEAVAESSDDLVMREIGDLFVVCTKTTTDAEIQNMIKGGQ